MTATQPAASVVRPAIVYVLLFSAVGAYFPYISVYYRETGLPLEAVGLLGALNAGVGLVAAPMWGALGDRTRDLRGPLVLAGTWAALSGAWLAFARQPVEVALAVGLLAVGSSGLGPMLDSLTVERLGERRERFGRARAWGSAAFIVGSLATGLLIDRLTARGLFAVYVPGLLLTSIAAYLLLGGGGRRRRTLSISPLSGLAAILRHPTLSLFLVGSILVWSAVTAVTTFVSVHLIALGAEGGIVGLVWGLGALVEVPLMFAFPTLARRFGNERLLVIAALAFAARSLGWALTGDPLLLVLFAPLGGIGFGLFYVGTVGYVARAVPAEVQATAQGVFSGTAFSMGSILGGVLGGQVAGAVGIPLMFGIAAGLTVLAGGLVWYAIVSSRGPAGRTGLTPAVPPTPAATEPAAPP